jgi:hypothetical protein
LPKKDTYQVTLGFRTANPAIFNINGTVLKELKENQFNGSGSQETCEIREISQDVTEDQKKLCLFAYSLTRDVKDWLHLLPTDTIQTWKELQDNFIERFFTEEQFQERKVAIMNFEQHTKDFLFQSHQRFKLLKWRCPNHKINSTALVLIFTNSTKMQQRMFLDASARGKIRNKTSEEVEELIEQMC